MGGIAVVTVASGGLPVAWASAAPYGMAVTEATRGLAVTQVAAGKPGLPVTYVTASGAIVSPFTPTTWNPADKSNATLSGSNLIMTSTAVDGGARTTASKSAGKYYWEVTMTTVVNTASYVGFGIASSVFGSTSTSQVTFSKSGTLGQNASGLAAMGARSNGDVIAFAIDFALGKFWARVSPSGNWDNNVAHNPATGAGGFNISPISGPLFPLAVGEQGGGGEVFTANFGASAFSGTVPLGFTAGWG